MNLIFVGATNGANFVKATDKNLPVNLCSNAASGPDNQMGLSTVSESIVMSQHKPNSGEVIFLNVVVGRLTLLGGSPFEGGKDHFNRVESAHQLAYDFLTAAGCNVREGLSVSFPKDFLHLEGVAEFMKYNPETDLYIPADRNKQGEDS